MTVTSLTTALVQSVKLFGIQIKIIIKRLIIVHPNG